MVTVRDFTKFHIPPPLSFEFENISRIPPYPGAENLIHPLYSPTYSPGWPGVLPLGEADDMCIINTRKCQSGHDLTLKATKNSTKMPDSDGLHDLNRSIGVIIVEVAFCALIGILALFGNVLVSLAVIRCPKLRTSTSMFILALAIADILTALICVPITCAILVSEGWINSSYFCHVQGFAIQTLALMSIGTLALTAVNRFFRVVKPSFYKRFFTKKKSLLVISIGWLSIVAFYTALLVSNSTHLGYEPSYAVCAIAHSAVQTAVEFVFVIIAFIVIVVCYTLVFVKIRRHQLSVVSSLLSGKARNSNLSVEEIKISKLLFMTVLGFAICWAPSLVIITMDRVASQTTPPRPRTLLCTYLNYLSAALNPFIYGVMNRSFRVEYKRILLCRKIQVVTPQNIEKNIRTFRNTARAAILWKRCVTPIGNEVEMSKETSISSSRKQEIPASAEHGKEKFLPVLSRSWSPCSGVVSFSDISSTSSPNLK